SADGGAMSRRSLMSVLQVVVVFVQLAVLVVVFVLIEVVLVGLGLQLVVVGQRVTVPRLATIRGTLGFRVRRHHRPPRDAHTHADAPVLASCGPRARRA